MDGTITMTGTTIAGNTADAVGGVPQLPAVLNICNSVIAQNWADGNGDDASSTLSASNTLSSYTGWTKSETCFEYDPDLPLLPMPKPATLPWPPVPRRSTRETTTT